MGIIGEVLFSTDAVKCWRLVIVCDASAADEAAVAVMEATAGGKFWQGLAELTELGLSGVSVAGGKAVVAALAGGKISVAAAATGDTFSATGCAART